METPKYRKGDRVKYPKEKKWGTGTVLENCQGKHLRVCFDLVGHKVLSIEGLSLSFVGRRPNWRFSTGKDICPFCKRRVVELKTHIGRSTTSKREREERGKRGGRIFFVPGGGKKTKQKIGLDDPMSYPYDSYWPKRG